MATRGMTVFSHNGTDYTVNDPNIAAEFSTSNAYKAGDLVNYQGDLYRFIKAHAAGSWNAGDVRKMKMTGILGDMTEIHSKNLWAWGDQVIDTVGAVNVSGAKFAAGTYTVSADIVTDAGVNARIWFYKDAYVPAGLQGTVTLTPNAGRQSGTITLEDEANIIYIGLVNSTTGYHTEWRDIQVESGSTETGYERPVGAVDDVARNKFITAGNLWPFGDAEFTRYADYSLSLPAGEYVISAVCENTDSTPYHPTLYRIDFKSGSTEVTHTQMSAEGVEGSMYFVLSEVVDNVRLFSSNTSSNATGHSCRWSRIMLAPGKYKKQYIPKDAGVDEILKYAENGPDEIARIENLSITKNMRFEFIRRNDDLRNVLIECWASWSGTETDEYHVPEVRFMFIDDGRNASGWYDIGAKGCTVHQQWRMPPFPGFTSEAGTNHFKIAIDVPSGLTLTISKLIVKYDDAYMRPAGGMIIHSHLDFFGYPSLSVHSMNAAARCGASHCIVIPKVSSDGTWFAYHDDTFDESTTLLRNADGSAIEDSQYDGLRFNQIPWSWLKTLDSGVSRNAIFAGTRLMTIDTFFDKCNRAGIHPVFSVHPNPTQSETQALYDMAKAYNVLDKLTLLPDTEWFTETCFPIFGNDVEMYKMGVGQNPTATNIGELSVTINGVQGLDKSKVCIALWIGSATDALIAQITEAGFRAGLHANTHTAPSGRSTSLMTSADYRYWQKKGVTVFMDGYNANMGLNW